MVNPKSILLKVIACFIGLVFVAGCSEKKKITSTPGPLFPQPQTVRLNLDEGYLVNQLTGDSIELLVDESDTIITGVCFNSKLQPINKIIGEKKVVTIANSKIEVKDDGYEKYFWNEFKKVRISNQYVSEELIIENSPNDTSKINQKEVKLLISEPGINTGKFRSKDNIDSRIQFIDTDEGLIDSYVNYLFEDSNGILWIATNEGGVSRYDGNKIINYDRNSGFTNDYVSSITQGVKDEIWFGTGGGLIKFDGNTFTHFNDGLGGISCLNFDSSHRLWLGGENGLICYENDKFTFVTKSSIHNASWVNVIFEDKEKSIWAGSEEGLMKLESDTIKYFSPKFGLRNNDITAICQDNKARIWIGSNRDLAYIHGDSLVKLSEFAPIDNIIIKNENVLISSFLHGLLRYSIDDQKLNRVIKPIDEGSLREIHVSNSGSIWLATYGQGVGKFKENSFESFSTKNGLKHNDITTISEDVDGILIGTLGQGINILKDSLIENCEWIKGRVNTIISRRNQSILVASEEGLTVKKHDTIINFKIDNTASAGRIKKIFLDKNENVWIAFSKGGISRLNLRSLEKGGAMEYQFDGALNKARVSEIIEDSMGRLWFGTFNRGLYCYEGDSIICFSEKEGLSSNAVTSVFESAKNDIWIGTNTGGLNRLRDSKFTYYNSENGLLSDNIRFIEEQKAQNNSNRLFIGTDKGLNILTSEINQQFTKEDGLPGVKFYRNSNLIDSENNLWFGTGKGKGLVKLKLSSFSTSEIIPIVNLKSIRINDSRINFRSISDSLLDDIKFDSVKRFENYPLNLTLSSDNNHLTFHFSAIDWSAPHKIQYSYVMEGLDTEWSKPSKEANADYRNLPHGTFTFKVRAIGESQEWSESFDYTFTILPPWYHTWWARTLYVLGGLILVFSFVKWRTAKLKKRQQELETEVENATQEIREQKEHIEEVHKEITDSINYAERIQKSFLATEDLLNKNLTEYFVFFQPKDVVSGDFYWADELSNGQFAMVNADSTGHGVPGAIMSILNISSLEEAVKEGALAPNDIFNKTRRFIIDRLSKDGSKEGGKDGMDASIICFDFEKSVFHYTAAQNPIWIVRDGELIDIKPEKMPMGKHDHDHIPFVGGSFDMVKGDVIYTLTDGFQDQFGGPKNKKFKIKPFKKLLVENASLPMNKQKHLLKEAFENWRGDEEQVDDVCVIGVRV